MKSAEEWIDNDLATLLSCSKEDLNKQPKERTLFAAFIKQIQQDAIASARDAALVEAAHINNPLSWPDKPQQVAIESANNTILALRTTKPTTNEKRAGRY